jgi:transketolase
MRNAVMQTLNQLASEGADVYLMTGDLGFKLVDEFRSKHPTRFINAGVAEANMVSSAAGMAMTGKRVFCYSMVPFVFMRAFEQLRMELCSQKLPVTLVGVGGGLCYGCEGHSHFAIEDIAIARSLPNLTTIAPGDPAECRAAVRFAAASSGPTFIRVGKNLDPDVHTTAPTRLDRGLELEKGGSGVTVLATGHILARAQAAVKQLKTQGLQARLISMPTIKPFDRETVLREAKEARLIVTMEEHSVIGGIGTEVAEILLEAGYRGKFMKIGLPDEYCELIGSHDHLVKHYRLDAPSLAERVLCAVKEAGIKQ